MSTQVVPERPVHNAAIEWLQSHRDLVRFSTEEWRQLVDDDRVALSGVSLLLTSIVGLGMLGMLVVVAILALG